MKSSPYIILIVMTLGLEMATSTVAMDVDNSSSNNFVISDDDAEYVLVEDNRTSLNRTNTNLSTQKKRSIKMIVGGNSENGLAKQITLPVNN